MSTLAYAVMTARVAPNKGEESSGKGGIDHYIEVVMGLVPAEVLALHATILSFTTRTEAVVDASGKPVPNGVLISDPVTLTGAFYGLIIVSVLFFIVPRILKKEWMRLDWLRAAIPPLAFVTWTALQKSTAFDAAFPGVDAGARMAGALFGATILAMVAAALPKKPNQNQMSLADGTGHRFNRALVFRKERVTLHVEQ